MTPFEIIIPTLNRADLLLESLEALTEKGIVKQARLVTVIDNGNQSALNFLGEDPNFLLIRPFKNLGVAASWNRGLENLDPETKGAFVLNDDIVWAPSLEEIDKFLTEDPAEKVCKSSNHWCAFWMGKEAFKKVGLFDEGFYPAYFEDNDWSWRASREDIYVKSNPFLNPITYRNSQTIAKNPSINSSFEQLKERYITKWGGLPGKEKWDFPWNVEGFEDWSISKTLFDKMREIIPTGASLVEFGSGDSTSILNHYWRVLSIEGDPSWAKKIKGEGRRWVREVITPGGKKTYKLSAKDTQEIQRHKYILIDGPVGDRRGILTYNNIFAGAEVIIVDDTHRKNEQELVEGIKKEYDILSEEEVLTHNKKALILFK